MIYGKGDTVVVLQNTCYQYYGSLEMFLSCMMCLCTAFGWMFNVDMKSPEIVYNSMIFCH